MESILTHGSKWPLIDTSDNNQGNDVIKALTFGNHKGASKKPDLLKELVKKDVKYGYSVPIPLESVTKIPGLILAPMNIMAQDTINKFGRVILKDRLTHDQSWKWQGSGTSVNSRVQ